MIESTRGNILEADAEALINTVNCVGVMSLMPTISTMFCSTSKDTTFAAMAAGVSGSPGMESTQAGAFQAGSYSKSLATAERRTLVFAPFSGSASRNQQSGFCLIFKKGFIK